MWQLENLLPAKNGRLKLCDRTRTKTLTQLESQNEKQRDDAVLADGRYELQQFISKGGMGTIYRARDVQLDRYVAVKFLLDTRGDLPKELALREARTLAALNHPSIMKIYDVVTRDNQVWIISEWLEGQTLATVKLPLTTPVVLALMYQVFDALAASHMAGVIHRDIKPANVMINAQGRVTLIDFGVAYAPGVSTGQTLVGSFRYTDPRILEGSPPDEASDLFSAGILMLQLLTGEAAIPDMAPLPLYRYARKHLPAKVHSLCATCYPPAAELIKTLVLKGDRSASARTAAETCRSLLGKLTSKDPDAFLAETFTPGTIGDHSADIALIREVNQAISDPKLAPRQKSLWLAFQNSIEKHHDVPRTRPSYRYHQKALLLTAIATVAFFWKFQVDDVEHSTFLVNPESPEEVQEAFKQVPPVAEAVREVPPEHIEPQVAETEKAQHAVEPRVAAEPKSAPKNKTGQASAEVRAPQKATLFRDPALREPRRHAHEDALGLAPILEIGPEVQRADPVLPTATYFEASHPSQLQIDGAAPIELPAPEPIFLTPGKHEIVVSGSMVETLSTVIEVKDKETLKHRFRLRPKMTKRKIVLERKGQLFINGVDYGEVKEIDVELPYGESKVWIKRDAEITQPVLAITPETQNPVRLQ